MGRYEVHISGKLWIVEGSKDDVIQGLMTYINGDGGGPTVKVIYPDKSWYELTGDDI